jgi:hypothetical protein
MAAREIANLFARLAEHSHGALVAWVAGLGHELKTLPNAALSDDPLSRSGDA